MTDTLAAVAYVVAFIACLVGGWQLAAWQGRREARRAAKGAER